MRTGVDVLRSLHRYVWKALEDDVVMGPDGDSRDWEIRLWGSEGEFRWPFARVAAITPVTVSGPAVYREAARTFAVHLYPVPQGTAEDSVLEAERVEEIMTIAFETGFTYIDKPDPLAPLTWVKVSSAPHRVPLYDFAGVPLDGPNSVSYARQSSDYLRVLTCSINRIIDPEDERAWLVVVEPRVTWRRLGRVPSDAGQIVQSVKLEESPA